MKKLLPGSVIVVSVMGTVAAPVWAQDSDWTYAASFYLYAAETTTQIGQTEAELSFSDALENLDMAFMGAFEARNGPWSFMVDYNFTDLGFDSNVSDPAFTKAKADVQTQVLTGYVAYRVFEDATGSIDLAGGFRYFDTDTEIRLLGGPPGNTASASNDWIDPLIALRAKMRFSDRWSATGLIDYGGIEDDRETWQVLVTANYAINDRWELRAGYRYLEVNNEINGNDFSFKQSGPVLGATINF